MTDALIRAVWTSMHQERMPWRPVVLNWIKEVLDGDTSRFGDVGPESLPPFVRIVRSQARALGVPYVIYTKDRKKLRFTEQGAERLDA